MKVVLRVDLYDEKIKQKAMKAVAGLEGLESIAINMKDEKLIVTGDIDPVTVVTKLRKICPTQILTVGPAKEEKKKDETIKEDPNKTDDKNKTVDGVLPTKGYPMTYYQQYHQSAKYYSPVVNEDPNGCVIC